LCINQSLSVSSCSRLFSGFKRTMSTYPLSCDESVRFFDKTGIYFLTHHQVMSTKAHGTCEKPVMDNLRYVYRSNIGCLMQ
jgi:hypothetical protein